MDDSNNLRVLMPEMAKQGVFSFSTGYLSSDLSWGMLRPFYPLMVFILYSPGLWWGPTAFFIFNALIVFAILYFCAERFAKVLDLNKWTILIWMFCLLHTYDLLQHPSLQEKIVQLIGALLLGYCAQMTSLNLKSFLIIVGVTVLGYLTKASFVIYSAMALMALVASLRGNLTTPQSGYLLLLGSLNGLCVLFLKYIGSKGTYTSRYGWSHALGHLKSPGGLFYLLLVAIGLTYVFFQKGGIKTKIKEAIPTAGIILFLLVFLPWGFDGYLQSITVIPVAALLAQLTPKRNVFAVGISVFAVTVAVWKSNSMFSRLHDIGKVINMGQQLSTRGEAVYMPCFEGRGSMEYYFSAFAKQSIPVENIPPTAQLKDLSGKLIMFDKQMCMLPFDASQISSCRTENLYESPLAKGYKLLKVINCF